MYVTKYQHGDSAKASGVLATRLARSSPRFYCTTGNRVCEERARQLRAAESG